MSFDPQALQKDFPILKRRLHTSEKNPDGVSLVYLDNAATSQKPQSVIDAISNYYANHNANVHRGVHQLGDESTTVFHQSRQTIAKFFGAKPTELIAVRNTTEALNLVALGWGETSVQAGDVILTTELEHHSNLVPWQRLARRKNATLQFLNIDQYGHLKIEELAQILKKEKVALLSFSHVSNTLGVRAPLEEMVKLVRQLSPKTKICVDGAQAAPHFAIDFQTLDLDFYAVSAHKMLGPMGTGGLFVRESLLKELEPVLLGGGMIDEVGWQETSYADDLEDRFTAGTPDVAGLVGWAVACEYLSKIGMDQVFAHDQELVKYSLEKLSQLPELELIGPLDPKDRVGSVTFLYKGVHAHDVGQILDSEGVAVRTGHHCTMPLHRKFGWAGSIRASFQVYNSTADIDALIHALVKVKKVFENS